MTISSFINALKRFVAIRGNVKIIRSDRGTNFVGAANSLHLNFVNVEDNVSKPYLVLAEMGKGLSSYSPISQEVAGVVPNLTGGSIVLLKNNDVSRRMWSLARIVKVLPRDDGRIRKVRKIACPEC